MVRRYKRTPWLDKYGKEQLESGLKALVAYTINLYITNSFGKNSLTWIKQNYK